jgi:serine/threonine-protein kinase
MAPEQAKGRSVDKRADIWAFGVVLYEMLTGRRLFQGGDASDVLAAVLRQELNWSDLPAETPAGMRRVIARCLERDAKNRLRDIGDVQFDLTAALEPPAAPVAIAPAVAVPRRRAAGSVLPWALAILALAGSAAWVFWRAAAAKLAQPVIRAQIVLKEPAIFVSVSRDGTRLAYDSLSGTSSATLMLRMMDEFDARPVTGGEGATAPIFSPDGQWIAYSTLDQPRRIRRIPITGGTSVAVCEGDLLTGAAWTDDDWIIFSGPKGLMRVGAAGGTPEALTSLDAAKHELVHAYPQVLPGGRQVLFSVVSDDVWSVAILDLASRRYRTVAKGGLNSRYVAGGHLTFVRGGTLFAVPFNLANQTVVGSEVPMVESVSTSGPANTADYSVSDTGLLAYVAGDGSGDGTTLAWTDRKGVTQPLPGQAKNVWGTGRLSPDGRRVANAIADGKGGADIWVLDVGRGTPTRLTFGGYYDHPVWTPDGRRIVYGGSADRRTFGIYAVVADGSGKPELVVTTDSAATTTSTTPDGASVLFDQPRGDRRAIFVVSLAAGGRPPSAALLHDASASEAAAQVSPDGRWVAYESRESGNPEIYVQPFPGAGAKVRVSAQGGIRARWSRDGRELFFWGTVPSGRLLSVDVPAGTAFNPGQPREVFQLLSGTTWDVTPDRNRFLVELSTGFGSVRMLTVSNWFDELTRRAPAKR